MAPADFGAVLELFVRRETSLLRIRCLLVLRGGRRDVFNAA